MGGAPLLDYGVGARLLMISATGATRILGEGFHSACDQAVSFDGPHLLFAGKKTPADSWDIYEMALDDSSVRRITKSRSMKCSFA